MKSKFLFKQLKPEVMELEFIYQISITFQGYTNINLQIEELVKCPISIMKECKGKE